MARKCQVLGKKTTSGNNRPFSLKATKRTFRPNLFVKTMFNPETGKMERMKLSAKAVRTLKKWAKAVGKDPEAAKTAAVKAASHKNAAGEGKHVKKEKLTPKQKKEIAAKKDAEMLGKTEETKEESK